MEIELLRNMSHELLIVTSNNKTDTDVETIRHAILATGKLYQDKPDLFRLFGPYSGKKDLLFKDSATGFRSIDGTSEVQRQYSQMLDRLKTCGTVH